MRHTALLRDRVSRHSELHQHGPTIGRAYDDVRRLDVPMDHPR